MGKRGVPLSAEHKQKISISSSGKNNGMYGKKHSEETRKKMSEDKRGKPSTFKGKKHSEESKKKLRESKRGENHPLYGKHHTEETKEKMRISQKTKYISKETRNRISESKRGIPLSKEHKRKISTAQSGENNPNWKGGVSCEPYCIQWSDKEYKAWIKYERDGNKCNNPQCDCKSTRLCLHHINYNKKDCRPTNLITLCIGCNSGANFNRAWHEAFYNEIMRRRFI